MIQPLRVRDYMTVDLHVVGPDTEIMTAVHKLVALNISGLLVVDDSGALAGILTERDCIDVALHAGYFDEAGGRVRNFMVRDVQTIDADLSLLDLADRFARTSFRRFPVTEDGKLVGLIARRDVLRALAGGNWFATPVTTSRS
jgi:CBS domain-containing protein